MLARLDEIDGVAVSRVDWTGTRILIEISADADANDVAERALEALGEGARRLDREETLAVVDSYHKGEAWMRSGETLRLSKFEAGVLAQRYGGEAAREIGLDEKKTKELVDVIEAELTRAFERAHAGSGLESVPAEFEVAGRHVLESSRKFLDAEQQAALESYLSRFKSGRNG